MGDERAAVSVLIESHQQRLHGFLRVRVKDDDTARDLAQETWAELWRHADTFDPGRGSFWTFTKIWADIVLKRHWEERRSRVDAAGSRTASGRSANDATVESFADEADELSSGGAAEAPEERLDAAQALLELLCFVNVCWRPPHEVIVFGFSKLKWKPSEIVGELSHSSLSELAVKLEEDYRRVAPLPTIDIAFCPLRGRLAYPLGHLIVDPRTRRSCAALLSRVAGQTTLADYLPAGRSAEAVVTQWWDSVKRAVFSEIRRAGHGPLFLRLYGEQGPRSIAEEAGR